MVGGEKGNFRARCVLRWMILVCLVASVVGPNLYWTPPASAQDGGEEEEEAPPIIFGYRHEVVFPAAIRFFLGINASLEDVESITLTVHQDSGLDHTFTLDLEETLIPEVSGGTAKQFLFEWPLLSDPSPQPFEPLSYLWEVTLVENTIATAAGQFYHVDGARGLWRTTGRFPLILHWTNANLAGQVIWDEVMAAYGLLDAHTEDTPVFQFAIYEPGARLCETAIDEETGAERQVVVSPDGEAEYLCSEVLFQQVYALHGITYLKRSSYGFSELEDQLVESMVRQTYGRLWGSTPVPAWFVEGLAALYRLRPGLAALELVRSAARTDSLIAMERLQTPLPAEATYPEQTLWEAESYLLVLFLAERYGAEAPFQLASELTQHGDGLDGALQALTGDDQEGVWNAWHRWLFTDAAEGAVGWTPYQPTTPTPTPTFTASPIPPSPTSTASPTATYTPTEVVLGNPQSTMIVSRLTPTRRVTPTNTPLPPGSLAPAPPPSAPASTDDDGWLRVLVIAGAVLGVAVMGAGGWLLLRRR